MAADPREAEIPQTMAAALLTAHGGIDAITYREDVPTPAPDPGQVLVRVTATAKNNTDRKVREGAYSTREAGEVTSFHLGGAPGLSFPRIQGADVVGRVATVGEGVDPGRVGERGLLDFNIYRGERRDINLTPDYYGHGADGGYAEYVAVPSEQFHAVDDPDLADAELAALGMCSYQTALRMLRAAEVGRGDRVLVTGASGGVGTALIQLCRILGAVPYALSTPDKDAALRALGAEDVLDRAEPETLSRRAARATGGRPIDAVMDLVGGAMTDRFIDAMTFDMTARATYPRLSIAGASGGNLTEVMWTRVYLFQVRILGVSHGTREDAEELVGWIRERRLRPVLHATFPLSKIRAAEAYFADRGSGFVGKIAIVPDAQWQTHGAPFALEGANGQ